jgi:hypothetical protein
MHFVTHCGVAIWIVLGHSTSIMSIKINFAGFELTASSVEEAVELTAQLHARLSPTIKSPAPAAVGLTGLPPRGGMATGLPPRAAGAGHPAHTGQIFSNTPAVARDYHLKAESGLFVAARHDDGLDTEDELLQLDTPFDAGQVTLSFLMTIHEAPPEGADGDMIAKSLKVRHAKGIGSRTALINSHLRKLGFEPDTVYVTGRTIAGRVWAEGPKIAEAIEAIRHGQAVPALGKDTEVS